LPQSATDPGSSIDLSNPGLPQQAIAAPLGSRAGRAALLLTSQAAVMKVASAMGQVALAWLLVPADFGLVGMASTVLVFAGLLQQGGVQEVLVQRQRRFRLWAPNGFWISVTLGLCAALLMLLAAPLAATIYKEPRLIGLMSVMAIGPALDALAVVPLARLQIDMRFRAIASVGFAVAISQLALSILLAWLGFGAYSIVLPKIPAAAGAVITYWRLAGVRIRFRPRPARWKFLISDSVYILGALFCYAIASQGAYMILGMRGQIDAVGRYWWAYNLSVQAVGVVAMQLNPVLFSSLTRLQGEPKRQAAAFLRSMRVLAAVVVPLSVLQAVVAEPAVKLLFAARWHAAIPLLQLLSVGMAFVAISVPAGSLMQSQGRFRAYFVAAVANLCLYVGLITAGASSREAVAIAASVVGYYVLAFGVNLMVAVAPGHVSVGAVLGSLSGSIVAAAIAGLAGFALQLWIGGLRLPGLLLLRIFAGAGVTSLLYLALVWRLQPAAWQELVRLVNAIACRFPGGAGRAG
jgi:O-antigen/teichoic acid export membrane protein